MLLYYYLQDPLWSNLRQQLGGLFTSAKLRKFQDHTRIKSKELVQRINNDRNRKVDILVIKKLYTLIDYVFTVTESSFIFMLRSKELQLNLL